MLRAALLALFATGATTVATHGGDAVRAETSASRALDQRDEHAVKAAFVYNFAARHVRWPDSAHKDKTSPFVIAVLGQDAIVSVLAETCRNRKSGDRAIEVRVVDDAESAAGCHLLFVPAARESAIPALAKSFEKQPLLIVGDSEEAVRRGAHLGFYLEKAKVRFAAHPPSARFAGLEISSELLKLARVVERGEVAVR